jgi:hypothetical protein
MRVIRVGFEPRRERSTSAVWIDRRTITRWVLQPARMAQIRRDRASEVVSLSPRRDPPPLRFGAALACFVSRVETGRDVGLAKSGFRPTGIGWRTPSGLGFERLGGLGRRGLRPRRRAGRLFTGKHQNVPYQY